jgi:multidrug efflux system outer membrane protein
MIHKIIYKSIGVAAIAVSLSACVPDLVTKTASQKMPENYKDLQDTNNSGKIKWNDYFSDPYLTALIDTALQNNQELNIFMREMEIARNEVQARKGEYLPFVGAGVSTDVEKVGRYTVQGASEATTDIKPGKETPEAVPNQMFGVSATWEVDIWRKLRNAKKAAYYKYLSTAEGRNFMVTGLIAEIANSYYELIALDNQLDLIKQNIEIQSNAFEVVKFQKKAGRVTELAVKRFEAQLLQTKSMQFEIQQSIVETENRINFLLGRFPQPIERSSIPFTDLKPAAVAFGTPAQLLENRTDVRQAEQELEAAKLNIKVSRANFYPSLGIGAHLGFSSFSLTNLLKTPESLMYFLGADLMGPIVNRNAIKAMYNNANAQQIQALYKYEQTVLNAYIEVANQVSNITNLQSSYDLKEQQVVALNESIGIANELFRYARADYMEVLLTQRDALESKFELIDTKMKQMHAWVDAYRALGGGWN